MLQNFDKIIPGSLKCMPTISKPNSLNSLRKEYIAWMVKEEWYEAALSALMWILRISGCPLINQCREALIMATVVFAVLTLWSSVKQTYLSNAHAMLFLKKCISNQTTNKAMFALNPCSTAFEATCIQLLIFYH